MYCYSAKCAKLFKLGHLYEDITWNIGALEITQQYIEYNETREITDLFENINFQATGFINKFIKNKGVIAIKSPMGTGKTQCLLKIVETFFNDKRVLYLSHRQTFSKNIEGTFKSLKFYNYMDKDVLYDKDKIIVQIDSLYKLCDLDGIYRPFDLIIMDEIESLLFHLSSNTITERSFICKIIKYYINKAPYVICLDADFGQRAYRFISDIKDQHAIKEKPKVLINTIESRVKRVFLLSYNYEKTIIKLMEDIKVGRNIVIVSLAKNIIEEITNIIKKDTKNIKIISHTSMTDDSLKDKLRNINDLWSQYQVVLYSPTVDAGCDFNLNHFDKMYDPGNNKTLKRFIISGRTSRNN